MIKRETITVSGTVLYCDVCKRRGPEAAYDNPEEVINQALAAEWDLQNDKDQDVCVDCFKANQPRKKKAR